MLTSKSKQSFYSFVSIYSYLIICILIFMISFLFLFHTKSSQTSINHRLKRQVPSANDKLHYTNMLGRILLHRTSSSVLADCTVNMAVDGIYRLPTENSLSSQIILLIEESLKNEILALRRVAKKIRTKLNQTTNYLNDDMLEKFRNDFSLDIRILLATHMQIKGIDVRILPNENIASYLIRYTRINGSISNIIDYEKTKDEIVTTEPILQAFTMTNVRETISNDQEHQLTTNGWWIGPVLCAKNKDETLIMANIFPLSNQ